VNVSVVAPNGQWIVNANNCFVSSVPGCSYDLLNLPQTGVYKVTVESQGQSTMSFNLTLSTQVTGALTAGTPLPVTLAVPGKMALLTFTATAGQTVALHFSSVSTTPAGKQVWTYVLNPSGGVISQATTAAAQRTLNLTNLAAGTYSVGIVPNDAATASATVTLANGLTGTLPANDTTQSFATTVPQQHGYFTFSANAGDDLGLALTNLVLTPSSPNWVNVSVAAPNGQWIVNANNCFVSSVPGCSYDLL